jgi:hypothetical protein
MRRLAVVLAVGLDLVATDCAAEQAEDSAPATTPTATTREPATTTTRAADEPIDGD